MADTFLISLTDEITDKRGLYSLPLDTAAHASLVQQFDGMAAELASWTESDFDVGYRPERGELQRVAVPLPQPLADHVALPHETPGLSIDMLTHAKLHYVAHVRIHDLGGDEPEVEIRFQVLDARRRLEPGKFLWFLQAQLSLVDRPGLHFSDELTLVYKDGTAVFRTYALANRVIPLAPFASSQGSVSLQTFAENAGGKIVFQNLAAIQRTMKPVLSRLLAVVHQRDLLAKYTPAQLQASARSVGVDLELNPDGKLVVPASPAQARLVLKLLAQQLLKCPTTAAAFETNSARPLS